jgi:2-polyprenyl-3-methyl-5-hydroxy-6-metoxy-1,4-benzoquinol methylase
MESEESASIMSGDRSKHPAPSMMITKACPICGSRAFTSYLTKRVHGTVYDIVSCSDCGLLYVPNQPSQEDLKAFYNAAEYFDGDIGGYGSSYLEQRPSIEREARRRIHQIGRILANGAEEGSRSILEIGCAAGFFLSVAKSKGWNVRGVELSSEMAEYARQLVECHIETRFDPNDYPTRSFSVIALWEVIEHLSDPLATLKEVFELLVPGGVVALSTPNTGHWHAQRRPTWWSEFKPPAHLVFFTEVTLRAVLAGAGFTDIAILRTRPLVMSPAGLARLHRLRDLLGDGADRRTPLWFLTSMAYRLTNLALGIVHRVAYPTDDLYVGLEAYARKPS